MCFSGKCSSVRSSIIGGLSPKIRCSHHSEIALKMGKQSGLVLEICDWKTNWWHHIYVIVMVSTCALENLQICDYLRFKGLICCNQPSWMYTNYLLHFIEFIYKCCVHSKRNLYVKRQASNTNSKRY